MKKIVKFVVVILLASVIGACTKSGDNGAGGETYLDVTPSNIAGVWRLVSYDNGTPLGEDNFFYIDFNRADHTFVSYDNRRTMYPQVLTGEYAITTDGAAVIRGMYDYEQGDWEHLYYVRELTATTMKWVATDNEAVVQCYVRDELPEELKALTPEKE